MAQEIKLHRDLNHPHIVKFISSFESKFWNVIVVTYYVMTLRLLLCYQKC